MAALVRQDAALEVVFPRAGAEVRANAQEIARLYDALDCVNENDNPRACSPAGGARSRKN